MSLHWEIERDAAGEPVRLHAVIGPAHRVCTGCKRANDTVRLRSVTLLATPSEWMLCDACTFNPTSLARLVRRSVP